VIKKVQTESAVRCANKKRAKDLTKILLDISSDQFEAIDHSHHE